MSEQLKAYEPGPCSGDDALFSGEVVLRLPNYDERMDLLIDNPDFFDEVEEPKKNRSESKMQKHSNLKKARALSQWSYQFYKKVDIKRKSDGYHFKSLEDLKTSNDCAGIIADVANRLSMGFNLGN